ncbi:MAG: hypothetical protein JWR75_855 [Devosia sp.]|nr:hypothetical protein [Devosia sp.]
MASLLVRSASRPKVFGIGFHKTGTSSLGEALTRLGYRVAGPFGAHDPDIANSALPQALALAERRDAFQDNPWPMLFREMDAAFPGSRFVLTIRPEAAWLSSMLAYFGTRSTPMRDWIYGVGSPVGNEAVYLERYQRHEREVRSYFANRPADMLVLRLTEGEGWRELCGFLELPAPELPFPHSNPAGERQR